MATDNPLLLRYEITDPPTVESVTELALWVHEELNKVQALLNVLADGQIEKTYVVPSKLRDGMVRFADGAQWNPGSGRGIYFYDLSSTAWVKLG